MEKEKDYKFVGYSEAENTIPYFKRGYCCKYCHFGDQDEACFATVEVPECAGGIYIKKPSHEVKDVEESKQKLVYLTIPYTFHPEHSFIIANKVAADLMNQGYTVFSPISMGHPISNYLEEDDKNDHDFWMKQCLPMVERCDKLVSVIIGVGGEELLRNSKGSVEEYNLATKLGKETGFYEYRLE